MIPNRIPMTSQAAPYTDSVVSGRRQERSISATEAISTFGAFALAAGCSSGEETFIPSRLTRTRLVLARRVAEAVEKICPRAHRDWNGPPPDSAILARPTPWRAQWEGEPRLWPGLASHILRVSSHLRRATLAGFWSALRRGCPRLAPGVCNAAWPRPAAP